MNEWFLLHFDPVFLHLQHELLQAVAEGGVEEFLGGYSDMLRVYLGEVIEGFGYVERDLQVSTGIDDSTGILILPQFDARERRKKVAYHRSSLHQDLILFEKLVALLSRYIEFAIDFE